MNDEALIYAVLHRKAGRRLMLSQPVETLEDAEALATDLSRTFGYICQVVGIDRPIWAAELAPASPPIP